MKLPQNAQFLKQFPRFFRGAAQKRLAYFNNHADFVLYRFVVAVFFLWSKLNVSIMTRKKHPVENHTTVYSVHTGDGFGGKQISNTAMASLP
mgnify:CR=1 FL=1